MAGGWSKLCKSPSPQHPLYKILEAQLAQFGSEAGNDPGARDCYWQDFVKPGQSRFPEAGTWWVVIGMDVGGQEDCCASRWRNLSWLSFSSQGQCLRKVLRNMYLLPPTPTKSCKECSIDHWVSFFFFFYYKRYFLYWYSKLKNVDIVGIHSIVALSCWFIEYLDYCLQTCVCLCVCIYI